MNSQNRTARKPPAIIDGATGKLEPTPREIKATPGSGRTTYPFGVIPRKSVRYCLD